MDGATSAKIEALHRRDADGAARVSRSRTGGTLVDRLSADSGGMPVAA